MKNPKWKDRIAVNPIDAFNRDLARQWEALQDIVLQSPTLYDILTRAQTLDLSDYYIGAGCITQTVWNRLSGYPPDYGISDVDLVYYDSNLEQAAEDRVADQARQLFTDIPFPIDVKNEARVHLWYEERFGYAIPPYSSLEDAINTWPTTATSMGLRIEAGNRFRVYAPFGLNDLFGRIIRPNKAQITEDIYHAKVTKWRKKWPELTVIPW